MQEIISLFTRKYGLTRSEVIVEIEKVFSGILSRRYGCEVMAVFQKDMQLEVVAYKEAGGIVQQRVIELDSIRGWNTIRRHQEKTLLKASVLKETRQYKYYEQELRWG